MMGVSLLGTHIALHLLDEWPPRAVFRGLPAETPLSLKDHT